MRQATKHIKKIVASLCKRSVCYVVCKHFGDMAEISSSVSWFQGQTQVIHFRYTSPKKFVTSICVSMPLQYQQEKKIYMPFSAKLPNNTFHGDCSPLALCTTGVSMPAHLFTTILHAPFHAIHLSI